MCIRDSHKIIDYCAGAGGKALAFGSLLHNDGLIWAHDINEERLGPNSPLAAIYESGYKKTRSFEGNVNLELTYNVPSKRLEGIRWNESDSASYQDRPFTQPPDGSAGRKGVSTGRAR